MKFEYALGATPLDLDEINGLIPSHITTQGQLNEWEAANILKAESQVRKQYINSLRDADQHDYAALAKFVGS